MTNYHAQACLVKQKGVENKEMDHVQPGDVVLITTKFSELTSKEICVEQ